MKDEDLLNAISLVEESASAYCYYITPNDVGLTGSHQCGFYIPKRCFQVFFEDACLKGTNVVKEVEITWQKDFVTNSVAHYYGRGSRNEYRLTKFSKGFEFLQDKYIGSLLIVARSKEEAYDAYVLSDQSQIEEFITLYDLDIAASSQMIEHKAMESPEQILSNEFDKFVLHQEDFPDTEHMAEFARDSFIKAKGLSKTKIVEKADSLILKWIDAEYDLFKRLEEKFYKPTYTRPFQSCQSLVQFANTILNRRKSRAGKSLEHHLKVIFTAANLKFEGQAKTENNKTPDFLFPDSLSYHNFDFPADKLTMLGAKTTCKDRWRQVISEADRIDEKHLFTLQCGVTKNQLQEMKDAHVKLVIPKERFSYFLPEFHDNIMCLTDFISMVRERQS